MFSESPTMSSVLVRSQFALKPFLGVALAIGSGVSLISPASAATFAFSQGTVQLSNFNVLPVLSSLNTLAVKNDQVVAVSDQADVVATGASLATFLQTAPAFSRATNIVEGTSGSYVGTSTGRAGFSGLFQVDSLFQFDLFSLLRVEAGVDDASRESAIATTSISLQLEDITDDPNAPILLDSLQLAGRASGSDPSVFSGQVTSGFTINANPFPTVITGAYSRQFNRATTLRLTEVTTNRSQVQASEPDAVPTPLLLPGLIGLCANLWRKCHYQQADT
jgi:hypothetical protein